MNPDKLSFNLRATVKSSAVLSTVAGKLKLVNTQLRLFPWAKDFHLPSSVGMSLTAFPSELLSGICRNLGLYYDEDTDEPYYNNKNFQSLRLTCKDLYRKTTFDPCFPRPHLKSVLYVYEPGSIGLRPPQSWFYGEYEGTEDAICARQQPDSYSGSTQNVHILAQCFENLHHAKQLEKVVITTWAYHDVVLTALYLASFPLLGIQDLDVRGELLQQFIIYTLEKVSFRSVALTDGDWRDIAVDLLRLPRLAGINAAISLLQKTSVSLSVPLPPDFRRCSYMYGACARTKENVQRALRELVQCFHTGPARPHYSRTSSVRFVMVVSSYQEVRLYEPSDLLKRLKGMFVYTLVKKYAEGVE
ncbi:hypothetical protein CC86DRAFT_459710 [Ophiobolus disseminans]|uniref:Uncharacterized protein n=1 Tax=Ophiobolus disseminans TaxID=1469910 RepID=A0A6A6ZH32_9PLEO|nr:hypothetical protein CC86DRAFT_459710 [Ophiobolus disseminans]